MDSRIYDVNNQMIIKVQDDEFLIEAFPTEAFPTEACRIEACGIKAFPTEVFPESIMFKSDERYNARHCIERRKVNQIKPKDAKQFALTISILFFGVVILVGTNSISQYMNESIQNNNLIFFILQNVAEATAIGLVLMMVFWILFVKTRLKKVLLVSVILCSILSSAYLVRTIKQYKEIEYNENITVQKINAIYNDFNKGKRINCNINNNIYEKYSDIVYSTTIFYNNIQLDFEAIKSEINSFNFNKILSAETYANVNNINITRTNLKEYLKILDRHEKKILSHKDKYYYSIDKSEIGKSFKEEMKKSITTSINYLYDDFREYYQRENAIALKTDEVLKFMQNTSGNYIIKGKRIEFKNPKDTNTYKVLIEELMNGLERKTSFDFEKST